VGTVKKGAKSRSEVACWRERNRNQYCGDEERQLSPELQTKKDNMSNTGKRTPAAVRRSHLQTATSPADALARSGAETARQVTGELARWSTPWLTRREYDWMDHFTPSFGFYEQHPDR
jgi:hypothetical protein